MTEFMSSETFSMSRHHTKLARRRWELTRLRVFEAAGWRCESCGKAGRLEADHRVALHRAPDQDLYALDGLQALCTACHLAKTRRENERDDPARARWRELVAELT